MVTQLAHEIAESITNPYGGAWQDDNGVENCDICAYQYGG
jgi:hypothetical protein